MILTPIGTVRSSLHDPSDAPRHTCPGCKCREGYKGARCAEAASSCTPPCQRYESLAAWLEIDPAYQDGLLGIRPGSELILITWLHLAERDRLQTHPRGDRSQPLTGVFSSRSPHRPNPLGLHRVRVLAVDPAITGLRDGAGRLDADWAHCIRLHVEHLEAVDGTPILDLESVMSGVEDWQCPIS